VGKFTAGDQAVGHNHPLPGQGIRAVAHRPPHLTGGPGIAQHPRDLAVGDNLALGDFCHERVHLREEGIALRLSSITGQVLF